MVVSTRQAAVALTFIPGVGIKTALDICRLTEGQPELAFSHPGDVGLNKHTAELLLAGQNEALVRAEEEIDWCDTHNIKVIPFGSADYPKRLTDVASAPVVLYYRGSANLNARHIVSVVGTRRPSAYGQDVCRWIAQELKQRLPDVIVVSGLAYGIDIHAHREALAEGLQTIAVLAHGLDRIYPADHRQTAAEMVEHGGLITEFPRKTIPDKGNFVKRNRIVAALSDATIVVESGSRGGSLITARLAGEFNREVFACPGRLHDGNAEGCIALIEKQAALIFGSVAGMLRALGWEAQDAAGAPEAETHQNSLFADVSALGKRLVELIATTDNADINLLIEQTGESYAKVCAELFNLEMMSLVRQLPGNIYRLV